MERIANFYGYDIFKPNKKECQESNTLYPMYIAVINYFDEPASEIDMSMSENDASTLDEQKRESNLHPIMAQALAPFIKGLAK